MSTLFEDKVLKYCQKIPKGKVTTYKVLAEAIGSPEAMRAVGNAIKKNKTPVITPCHRVIKSNGSIGGYVRGQARKIELLKKEGVKIKNYKVDLSKYLNKFKKE